MSLGRSLFAALALSTVMVSAAQAQQEKAKITPAKLTESKTSDKAAAAPKAAAPAPKPAPITGVARWLHFQTLDLATRFRYVDTHEHRVNDRDQQYKISSKFQLNLVPEGRTYFQFRVETGSSFASSWTNMGPGMHNREWVLNVKSLFFGQKLGKHFEAQVGGIEYDQGAGSEVTSTDNDAWLIGYRGRVITSGKGWLPNKVNLTIGHMGDFRMPNVFARMHRLEDVNYVQALAQKSFNKKHEGSFEYDSIQDIQFLRFAYRWKKIPAVVFDEISIEPVVRMTNNSAFGWSGTLGKSLDKAAKLKIAATYSDIPTQLFNKGGQQILLNGDLYALGKRVSGTMTWQPAKDWQFQAYAGRRMDATNSMRWRAQVAVRYNFANLANKALR